MRSVISSVSGMFSEYCCAVNKENDRYLNFINKTKSVDFEVNKRVFSSKLTPTKHFFFILKVKNTVTLA